MRVLTASLILLLLALLIYYVANDSLAALYKANNESSARLKAEHLSYASLDATTWSVSVTETAQAWHDAQALAGVPTTSLQPENAPILENWNKYCMAISNRKIRNVSYVPIAKAGSEGITANLEKWRDSSSSSNNNNECLFTFVRDPLDRFVSAYVEFEWRYHTGVNQKVANVKKPRPYTFYKHSVGTPERAATFVKDLLTFDLIAWLNTTTDVPKYLNWFKEHKDQFPFLFHRNGIHHICPMVSQLWGKKMDFIGQIHRLSGKGDWHQLGKVCRLDGGAHAGSTFWPYNRTLYHHITSEDPQKAKRAMRQVLDEDCHLKTSLCLLFKADYDILSPLFNYTCTGCNGTVVVPKDFP